MSIVNLHDHYASILQTERWQRIEADADTDAVWSLWRFADHMGNEWVATLTVLEPTQESSAAGGSEQVVILEAIPLGHSIVATPPQFGASLTRQPAA